MRPSDRAILFLIRLFIKVGEWKTKKMSICTFSLFKIAVVTSRKFQPAYLCWMSGWRWRVWKKISSLRLLSPNCLCAIHFRVGILYEILECYILLCQRADKLSCRINYNLADWFKPDPRAIYEDSAVMTLWVHWEASLPVRNESYVFLVCPAERSSLPGPLSVCTCTSPVLSREFTSEKWERTCPWFVLQRDDHCQVYCPYVRVPPRFSAQLCRWDYWGDLFHSDPKTDVNTVYLSTAPDPTCSL